MVELLFIGGTVIRSFRSCQGGWGDWGWGGVGGGGGGVTNAFSSNLNTVNLKIFPNHGAIFT